MFKKLFKRGNGESDTPQTDSDPLSTAAGEPQLADSRPSPNQDLIAAMEQIAQAEGPDSRKQLYEALQHGWLWIPIAEPPTTAAEDGKSNGETQLKVITPSTPDGKKVLLTFTDEEALVHFTGGSHYVSLPTPEAMRIAVTVGVDHVVLNPFPQDGKPLRPGGALSKEEFELLAQGRTPSPFRPQERQVNPGAQIYLGRAQSLPEAAAAELQKAARYEPIREMFLIQMQMPPAEASRCVVLQLTTEMSEAASKEMFQALAERIRPHMQKGESLDFVIATEELAQVCREHGETLYTRPQ
ncbi:MAG TPA: SseB family protein [Terriglobales bacterium]